MVIRKLECGCIDEQRHEGGPWVVFVLCSSHAMGRIPEQDKK